jgi:hypothetical protein
MCANASPGITAHKEFGKLACRKRQMYSISLLGNSSVFGMSMNDDKVLTPGTSDLFFASEFATGLGAGGGLKGGNESAIEGFLSVVGDTRGSRLKESIFGL